MNELIKDLKAGDHIEGKYMISKILKGVTKTGNNYLTITIRDSSKALDCKLWEYNNELEKQLKTSHVYQFIFDVQDYQNNLQGKIISVLPIPQDDINPQDYANKGNVPIEELKDNYSQALNMISNEKLVQIVKAMLDIYGKKVFEYPAATKNHHDFLGGLATHTSGMLKVGMALCNIYPSINRDYLLAGILVHDLGKIEEYTSSTSSEYSTAGNLLGHISICDAHLLEVGIKLNLQDSQELLILRHMILSHHGQLEFGSPVRPATLEAEMLNFIDNIDARVNMIDKALADIKEGEFSGKVFALDGRMLYKPKS